VKLSYIHKVISTNCTLHSFDNPTCFCHELQPSSAIYSSVSQPPGHGPVPGPGINYTGLQEA